MLFFRPRRAAPPPGVFGFVCASALLAACVILPEETLGFRTPYFFSGIIIAGCFAWAILRLARGKKDRNSR